MILLSLLNAGLPFGKAGMTNMIRLYNSGIVMEILLLIYFSLWLNIGISE